MSDRSSDTPFTRRIAQAMIEHPEVTQEVLAELLDVSQPTMSNYLNGVTLPSKTDAQRLGERLETDLMQEWKEVRSHKKEKGAQRRAAGHVERKRGLLSLSSTRISTSEETFKKYDALPPKEQERIKKIIDDAFRKYFDGIQMTNTGGTPFEELESIKTTRKKKNRN